MFCYMEFYIYLCDKYHADEDYQEKSHLLISTRNMQMQRLHWRNGTQKLKKQIGTTLVIFIDGNKRTSRMVESITS